MDRLAASLRHARAGRLAIVVVTGGPGMGKTRLVEEFLLRSVAETSSVLTGTCPDEGGDLTPLGPVEHVVRQLDDVAPELLDPATSVERRLRGITDAVRAAARHDPGLVVVLGDLHWADDTTLEFVRYAAHALVMEPVLLVLTHRDGRAVHGGLRGLLAALDRLPGSARIVVGPLERSAQEQLVVDRADGELDDRRVDEVLRRAAGVTLFVEELARSAGSGDAHRLPPRLQDAFAAQVERVSPGAAEVLDVAAVCGQQFTHELLRRSTDAPDVDVERHLDELLDADLLVASDDQAYAFRHVLLHEVVRGGLRPAVARRLHTVVASVLADHPDLLRGPAMPQADLARRWARAGRPREAFLAHLDAAEEAASRAAHGEASRLWGEACRWIRDVVPGDRDGHREADLLRRAGDAALVAGDHADAIARHRRGLELADPDDPVRVGLWSGVVLAAYRAGDLDDATAAASRAVAEDRPEWPPGERARLLIVSAGLLAPASGRDTARERVALAADLARRSDDPDVRAEVLGIHGYVLTRQGLADEAEAVFDEASAAARSASSPTARIQPALSRMQALQCMGAFPSVRDLGRSTLRLADHLGVARGVGQQVRAVLADALVALGDFDEAEAVVDEGLAWRDAGLTTTMLRLVRAELDFMRGRFADAARDIEAIRVDVPGGHWRLSLVAASVAWWQRDAMASRNHAADGLARAGVLADPDELGRLVSAFVRAEHAVDARGLGGLTCDQAIDRLATASQDAVTDAWVAAVRATHLEASPDEDPAAVAAAWEASRAHWEALERRPMLAKSAWRAGVAHHRAGDDAAARTRLREAEELGRDLGSVPVMVEARASLAEVRDGPTRDPSTPRPDPSSPASPRDWFEEVLEEAGHDDGGVADDPGGAPDWLREALTTRELEVLGLVARGWTNKHVGEELGISGRTVGSHVSRILDKLDVDTRGEAAAVYHRHGH